MTNFIDLHGVLVDFVGACNERFDVDIYSDPKHHGDWHAPAKVIPNFVKRVSAQNHTFWSEMSILPNAHKLLDRQGDAVILTTPWGNAASFIGTKKLIETCFPGVHYIFADQKHVLAKGNFLLDDKEENINAWREAGGRAHLHAGLMNKDYAT